MSAQGLLLNAVPAFPAAATLATPSTLTLARHVAALRLTQQAVSRRALPLAPSAFPTCAALAAQRPLWGIAFGRPLVSAAASQQPSPVAPAAPPIIDRATPPLSAAGGKDADAAADDGTAKKPRARRPKKALMTVSENAVQRLKELFSQKNAPPAGIRLGVRTRGCNGLSYTMNYVDEAPKLDEVVEATDGVKVFVDPKAVMFLIGAHMDFVEDAVKAEFTFVNPNAKGSCGCGESFNV